ncbi:MAG: sulfatase-like hydrolase/transferase, partial [Bacteroidota bacterium]
PNIIVVVVDDAGYADWGFQGSKTCKTPNVDKLRNEGINFTQAYVTGATCAPSRAGLMTGRYQNRFGYEYNPSIYPSPGKTLQDVGMEPNEKTIADHLKKLGYNTAAIGKWHLGEEMHHHPNNRGFDYFYGLLAGARPYFHTDDLGPNKKLMRNFEFDDLTEGYMTDVLTNEALAWMKTQVDTASAPFFTYLSYTAIHGPYKAKPKDYKKHSDSKWKNGKKCSDKRKNYLGMADNLDLNIGKLTDSLKTWNIFDNTLIFFINDNGGKAPKKITDNGVLRAGKGSPYEGGYRVPFFMVWPGHVPKDSTYPKQVISMDIAATSIIAAGGGKLQPEKKLDGVDLMPVVNDTAVEAHEYLFWRKYTSWAVAKTDNHKIIVHYNKLGAADNDTTYYILNTDGSGENDVNNIYSGKGVHPIADDLMQKYNEWEKEMVKPYFLGPYVAPKFCKPVKLYPNCNAIDSLFRNSTAIKPKKQ